MSLGRCAESTTYVVVTRNIRRKKCMRRAADMLYYMNSNQPRYALPCYAIQYPCHIHQSSLKKWTRCSCFLICLSCLPVYSEPVLHVLPQHRPFHCFRASRVSLLPAAGSSVIQSSVLGRALNHRHWRVCRVLARQENRRETDEMDCPA